MMVSDGARWRLNLGLFMEYKMFKKFVEGSLYIAALVIGFLTLLGRTAEIITHSEFKTFGMISCIFLGGGYLFSRLGSKETSK